MRTWKILAIVTKSRNYISDFYGRHPFLAGQPYQDQYAALAGDAFGASEIWCTGLSRFGYEAVRVYENIPHIQQRWAQEAGIRCDESSWRESVVSRQVAEQQPDILFIANHAVFSNEFVRNVRKDNPCIRLVIGWCGSPYRDPRILRKSDVVLSNIPELVEDIKANGHRCYHIHHAFDPRVLDRIDTSKAPTVGFSFLGSIITDAGFHGQREGLLIELVKATDLEIWSPIRNPPLRERLTVMAAQVSYDIVRVASLNRQLKDWISMVPRLERLARRGQRPALPRGVDGRIVGRSHPPLYGVPMFQKMRDSRVTLNTHIDASPRSASNMRLFEATGVGACLLTDWKQNLKDLFDPDAEVATYRDPEECVEKARYLLENERQRQQIAASGQRRALGSHTIYHRAEQLDGIIREHLRKL